MVVVSTMRLKAILWAVRRGETRLWARDVQTRPDGSFYYNWAVPKGLKKPNEGKRFIRRSPGTKPPSVAARKATKLAV